MPANENPLAPTRGSNNDCLPVIGTGAEEEPRKDEDDSKEERDQTDDLGGECRIDRSQDLANAPVILAMTLTLRYPSPISPNPIAKAASPSAIQLRRQWGSRSQKDGSSHGSSQQGLGLSQCGRLPSSISAS